MNLFFCNCRGWISSKTCGIRRLIGLKGKTFRLGYILWVVSFWFSGCASVDLPDTFDEPVYTPSQKSGVYHKVGHGETLWRIAKTYDVDMQDVIRYNNIPDVARVEENQLIFIPGAYSVQEVITDTLIEDKDFIWPVKGKVVCYFNERIRNRLNKGIDIEVPQGSVVHAARTGRVVFADNLMGYGKTIILDHQDGFFSVYAHNSQMLVGLGEMVLKSKEIAHIGKRNDTAVLHFQIRKNSKEENPFYYLP